MDRSFSAEAPNHKRVTYCTCVRTCAGFAQAAFAIDHQLRHMTADLVLTALTPANPDRLRAREVTGLLCHTHAASQYPAISHTQRPAQAHIDPSVASVGDSHNDAPADTAIRLFAAESVGDLGPWQSLEDLAPHTRKGPVLLSSDVQALGAGDSHPCTPRYPHVPSGDADRDPVRAIVIPSFLAPSETPRQLPDTN